MKNNLMIAEACTIVWAMGFDFPFRHDSLNPPTDKKLEKWAQQDMKKEVLKNYAYYRNKKQPS